MPTLTYRGVDIRRTDRSIFLEVIRGFDDEVDVRGADAIIVGKSGRFELNRVKDVRIVGLEGWVLGIGTTLDARRLSYRTLVDELHAIFDPTLAPGALVATTPYLGIATGTKTIQVRYVNSLWDDPVQGFFRRVSVELECIASPPNWT